MPSLHFKYSIAFVVLISLTACGQRTAAVAPPGMKIGKPYDVDGKTYYPEQDDTYDKVGDGSWYGPGFNGKRTASGEIFNENDLTAAHPTLPMPSLVRVTNLKNGKSVIVRINDRGPFKSSRIIDLSKKSAEIIGLHSTMPVRVQYLKKETEAYIASILAGGDTKIDMADYQYSDHPAVMKDAVTAEVNDSDQQIVESTSATPSYNEGEQGISNGAPVTSITSKELSAPVSERTTIVLPNPIEKSLTKSAVSTKQEVYKKDWASDALSLPEPPTASNEEPEMVKSSKAVQNLAVKKPEKVAVVVADSKTITPVAEKFTILVGSFASEANAHKLAEKLSNVSDLKIPVSVENVMVGGKQWVRVHAGPFKKKGDAERALEIIHAAHAPDARIVSK